MPCLSIVYKSFEELDFQGCEYVYVSSTGGFLLQNCRDSSLSTFEVQDRATGRQIARPYNESELKPDEVLESFNASQTLQEVFGNVMGETSFVVFGTDIGPILSDAGSMLVMGTIDMIASTFLPNTFNRASSPARNATVMDFFYLLLSSSLSRLDRLVTPFQTIGNSTLAGDAVYGDLVSTQPDPISLPEVLSGITLLLLVTTGFGYALSTPQLLSVPVLGAFLVFATEVTSFILRLKDSVELDRWEESMMLVYTRVSSRNYALILNSGYDGSGLAVTVASVRLTNTSETYIWLQVAGAVLAVAFFFVGLYWGRGSPNSEAARSGGGDHLGGAATKPMAGGDGTDHAGLDGSLDDGAGSDNDGHGDGSIDGGSSDTHTSELNRDEKAAGITHKSQ
jgi:hypothetical protein